MGWWLTPMLLGALAITIGVVEHEIGWLQWIGVGLVVVGLAVGIVRPGGTRQKPGRPSDLRGTSTPYFG
ncbi:hypothetical protein ACPYO6_14730 [Georgenia sp. Z1344]|uniref:hypothetical protein n=1 Tax=Georgenia sp. Z1344 TaxID=3416706 RepID=UPI003CFB94C0